MDSHKDGRQQLVYDNYVPWFLFGHGVIQSLHAPLLTRMIPFETTICHVRHITKQTPSTCLGIVGITDYVLSLGMGGARWTGQIMPSPRWGDGMRFVVTKCSFRVASPFGRYLTKCGHGSRDGTIRVTLLLSSELVTAVLRHWATKRRAIEPSMQNGDAVRTLVRVHNQRHNMVPITEGGPPPATLASWTAYISAIGPHCGYYTWDDVLEPTIQHD